MPEEKPMEDRQFKAMQYTPITIVELNSAVELNKGWFQTRNGIKFSAVELLGMIKVKTKKNERTGESDMFGVLSTTLLQTQQVVYINTRFVDNNMKDQMAGIVDDSIVIVRGNPSIYKKGSGETSISVKPYHVVEITGESMDKMRELVFLRMLKRRVDDRIPIIINDELAFMASEADLVARPLENDDDLALITPSVEKEGGKSVAPQLPLPRQPSIAPPPAQKPSIPKQIAESGAKKMAGDVQMDTDKAINYIASQIGIPRNDVLAQVTDIVKTHEGLVTISGAITIIATDLKIDLNAGEGIVLKQANPIETKPAPPEKPAPAKLAKPRSTKLAAPEKPPSSQPQKDPEKVILDTVSGSPGKSIDLHVLYDKVKRESDIKDNVTQEVVIKLFGTGKLKIDGNIVTMP